MNLKPITKDFFSLPLQARVVSLLGVGENFCPISRHMPFSSEPFLYGFSIAKNTHTAELIQKEKIFTLQFFDSEYTKAVHALGKVSGENIDKRERSSLEFKHFENILYSPKSLWGMVCQKKEILDYGDHFVVVGEPKKFWHTDEKILQDANHILFYGRGWYSESNNFTRISKDIHL